MAIRVLAVGRKHESWVSDGIARYEKRLKKPFDLSWQFLPHSAREGDAARAEESERLLTKTTEAREYVILLDERGRSIDSPAFSRTLGGALDASRPVTFLIGGAYGVDDTVHRRADFVLSLSKLVFPHQLVRLILAEQVYRAQEIAGRRSYHHE
ncbi:23S rRNA (pseudouridine(1915)-N(3))-methyltransferase RlmH [Arthrobacter sp. MSA 4-2]|uniref:23S rRNA (pseudouridine(1915)-N(3))-methyltransferase RlmH n=1 Tax=Arthrobacter sp. MSA 4-2 TaxID=2794349 RepID=UPI0018E8F6B5|nr:23S rRNA (pseudouridine(1915)-N(3))-methyltransferase RlmH [Arthrobacter sp. MSA 4-2]MBJ2120840.1 23S rRNA (pseudouridine(1915)-N(3))-methyltransferase RlmH [Arthrobacter sp. MSA 4-2]